MESGQQLPQTVSQEQSEPNNPVVENAIEEAPIGQGKKVLRPKKWSDRVKALFAASVVGVAGVTAMDDANAQYRNSNGTFTPMVSGGVVGYGQGGSIRGKDLLGVAAVVGGVVLIDKFLNKPKEVVIQQPAQQEILQRKMNISQDTKKFMNEEKGIFFDESDNTFKGTLPASTGIKLNSNAFNVEVEVVGSSLLFTVLSVEAGGKKMKQSAIIDSQISDQKGKDEKPLTVLKVVKDLGITPL